MQLDEAKINDIVEKVLKKLETDLVKGAPTVTASVKASAGFKYGVFEDVDAAIDAAEEAFLLLEKESLFLRNKILESLRNTGRRLIAEMSRMAVEETGMGRVEDKIKKNTLALEKTPGVEVLTPTAWTGDEGFTLRERAPWGVIGSITPCTNATETIICNAIGMLAGGNAVVFNVHPTAKNISIFLIQEFNKAIIAAGGPPNLLCTLAKPTIESAQRMMKHEKIRLLVVTGGPAVVKVAMNSGKKVIAAGPGNPPVVVDETADIEQAAKDIVAGASLDNNIVCIVEKEIIAVTAIADKLNAALKRNGAHEVTGLNIERLVNLVVKNNEPNKDYIGKNAKVILDKIGISVGDDIRIVTCEVKEDHPLVQLEMLMPVIPFVRVANVDEAIAMAKRVEHGFRHTAVMHSTNIHNLSKMARTMNTSIFVKNAPSYAGLGLGGEGYASFTIASPTGEGLTCTTHFTRERRCVMKDAFRIV